MLILYYTSCYLLLHDLAVCTNGIVTIINIFETFTINTSSYIGVSLYPLFKFSQTDNPQQWIHLANLSYPHVHYDKKMNCVDLSL